LPISEKELKARKILLSAAVISINRKDLTKVKGYVS